MSHEHDHEHGPHCHHDHEHHHDPEIKVAHPEPNVGAPTGHHGQPLPGVYDDPNPNAVITELEDGTVKIVITYSITVFTYYVKPTHNGLKITTLLPHGIIARHGNNGEIFIEPTHVN